MFFFTISPSPSASGVTLAPSTSVLSSASSTRCQLVKLVSVCLGVARARVAATPFWKMGSTPSSHLFRIRTIDIEKKHIQLLDAKTGTGKWREKSAKIQDGIVFEASKVWDDPRNAWWKCRGKTGCFFLHHYTRSETFLMGIFQQKSTCFHWNTMFNV